MNKFLTLHVAKLVGVAGKRFWAQTHVYTPKDKKKLERYGSLFASLAFKAKTSEVDTASFGKEVISRFHELYYSSLQADVLEKLKKAVAGLVEEFKGKVKVEVAAVVVFQPKNCPLTAYFALSGRGRAAILRGDELFLVLSDAVFGVKTASGFLEAFDLVVCGTEQFFKIVSFGVLKAALGNKDVGKASECLAPVVHGREFNSRTSAIIFSVEPEKEEKKAIGPYIPGGEMERDKQKEEGRPFDSAQDKRVFRLRENVERRFVWLTSRIKRIIGGVVFFAKNFPRSLPKRSAVFIREEKGKKKRVKKTSLTVAVVLLAVLIASVFLGSKKSSLDEQNKKTSDVFEGASYKYEQAVSLMELNPLRSKTLLNEAKTIIEQAEHEVKERNEIKELLGKIKTELEKASREYNVEQASVFLDLTLIKENFRGGDWDKVDSRLIILDKERGVLLAIDIKDKSSRVLAGSESLSQSKGVAASGNRAFVIKSDKVLVFDIKKEELIEGVDGEDWGEIVDFKGFTNNLYLLDEGKGKVWKYAGTDSGLGSARDYCRDKVFLDGVKGLGIDGSIWILFDEGTIFKFTSGQRDAFSLSGFEGGFNQPERIYTDEDLSNLYILDKGNTRVVVINKETGEFEAQYIWSGIAGASDIFASEEEGKILLLTGERIYEIEMKE